MRQRRAGRRRVVERQPVLVVEENLFDGAKAIGAEALRAVTRRFEAIGAMDPAEPHETEARAVALFGMRAVLEDACDEPPGGGPGLFGPPDQARRRPFGVRPMRPRHVRELCGKSAATGEAGV